VGRLANSPAVIVIASANGEIGTDAAWEVLAAGGSALDAVEAGIRLVEDNPADHTVGYSGYPNVVGEVELDASIMDGATRAAGAVGGLRGYREAISVARAVLERLPHVLVVGAGAAQLAADIGLQPAELLTPEAERVWREGLDTNVAGGVTGTPTIDQVQAVIGRIFDPELTRAAAARAAAAGSAAAVDPAEASGDAVVDPGPDRPAPGGTVNFLAVDAAGHMASGVSTSGWAWKYPGRLGDSPIIGAGNYCDDRHGGAACTGWGELTIRASTARTVVAGLAAGASLADACAAALRDLVGLEPGEPGPFGYVNLVALDRDGNHHAASTKDGTEYVWRADGMARTERAERTVVAV